MPFPLGLNISYIKQPSKPNIKLIENTEIEYKKYKNNKTVSNIKTKVNLKKNKSSKHKK